MAEEKKKTVTAEEKQRNTYKEDERYTEEFNIRHLLLAGSYIKK